MDVFRKAPGQIVFEGQNVSRTMVLGSARKYIVDERHVHELDADDLLIDLPNRVTRAWWKDGTGFVQEESEGAVAVTVVNISNDERVFGTVEARRLRNSDAKMTIL